MGIFPHHFLFLFNFTTTKELLLYYKVYKAKIYKPYLLILYYGATMAVEKKVDEVKSFVRFPKSLYLKLSDLAKAERRSINSEILIILELYLKDE